MNIPPKTSVGVYILTHNRLSTFIRSLESVLAQTFEDMTVIVSDNSDNNDTEDAMRSYLQKYKNLIYVHHHDVPSSHLHFDRIINDNRFEYFMMFHDDDRMMPTMVETLYNAIVEHPEVSAVVGDAFLNKNGLDTSWHYLRIGKPIIMNAKEYAYGYINRKGVPAFPGYMYRSGRIIGTKMDASEGGPYRDASFIVKIADLGGILVLPTPLMYYYITQGKDSQNTRFVEYLQLIKFMKKYVNKDTDIVPMRLYNIYNELKKNKMNIIFKRKALLLFFRYSTLNYFPKYVLRLLKLYNK